MSVNHFAHPQLILPHPHVILVNHALLKHSQSDGGSAFFCLQCRSVRPRVCHCGKTDMHMAAVKNDVNVSDLIDSELFYFCFW